MFRRGFKAVLAAGVLATTALTGAPASALNIVLNADSSFTSSPNGAAALLGFQKAANYWNTVLTNNVTLVFDVHFDDLGANVLGGTYSNTFTQSSAAVYQQLQTTGNSALDAVAVSHLSPLSVAGGVNYRTPSFDASGNTTAGGGSRYDNNNSANNLFMNVNTSVNKALGLSVDYSNSLFAAYNSYYGTSFNTTHDADITFSSTFGFDYNPTDGIQTGKYDFVGVAIHEMGHALGFVSGLDDYDYSIGQMNQADVDGTPVLTTLDLFRYGANNPRGNTRDLQLDPNRPAIFSIDGSLPFNFNGNLADASSSFFATGANFGDGGQGSHWQDANALLLSNGCYVDARQIGIMDPTASACGMGIVTSNDLAAFDAMGWNTSVDVMTNRGYAETTAQAFALDDVSPAPEPGEWAMMAAGLGIVGAVARRRKRA